MTQDRTEQTALFGELDGLFAPEMIETTPYELISLPRETIATPAVDPEAAQHARWAAEQDAHDEKMLAQHIARSIERADDRDLAADDAELEAELDEAGANREMFKSLGWSVTE